MNSPEPRPEDHRFNLLPNPYFTPFPPCVTQEGCAIVKDTFKDIRRAEFPDA